MLSINRGDKEMRTEPVDNKYRDSAASSSASARTPIERSTDQVAKRNLAKHQESTSLFDIDWDKFKTRIGVLILGATAVIMAIYNYVYSWFGGEEETTSTSRPRRQQFASKSKAFAATQQMVLERQAQAIARQENHTLAVRSPTQQAPAGGIGFGSNAELAARLAERNEAATSKEHQD